MSHDITERFCAQCGVSLVPLSVPFLSAPCEACGKTRHFVRPGDDGKGVKIEAGETFTIPAEWLTLSFDPVRSRGKLLRPGVPFLLKRLIVSGMPAHADEFQQKLQALRDAWNKEMAASDDFAGIDLEGPNGGDTAIERFESDKDSWAWHMILKDVYADITMDAVKAGDTQKAALCALHMGLLHSLSVVTEPYFKEMVWRGYLAGLAIHESANAADHIPGEVEALKELDPLFRMVGEATIHTWIDSKAAIGPRIGSSLPEEVLTARAKWHLEAFRREREERTKAPAERRADADLRLRGLSLLWTILGSGTVGIIIGKLLP